MVTTRAAILLSTAMTLAAPQLASAADLYGGGYGGSIKDDGVVYEAAPSARPSIYFRVDGGYSAYDTPSLVEDHFWTLTETSIDSHWSVGGGVGMYFGKGWRGDLTLERRFETDVSGNLGDPLSDLPGVRDFGLSSTVGLANVYYDFDFGRRFTPYLGVGLGFAHTKTSSGTVTDPCGCLIGTIDGATDTSVAAAAMAGFTVKLRDRLSFDAGYRFLYIDEATTGPVNATYSAPVVGGHPGVGTVSQDPAVDDIHAHEIRFGLRYDIN